MEGAAGLSVGGRSWFVEQDRPGRRLGLHPRPAEGKVSVSLWDGVVCRATFHLPAADIPRMVYELAAALGAPSAPAPAPAPPAPADPVQRVEEILRRALRRLLPGSVDPDAATTRTLRVVRHQGEQAPPPE